MTICWEMDKQHVVYLYKKILFVHKDEWSTDKLQYKWPWKTLCSVRKACHKRSYIIPLTWHVQVGNLIETESRSVADWAGMGGEKHRTGKMTAEGHRMPWRPCCAPIDCANVAYICKKKQCWGSTWVTHKMALFLSLTFGHSGHVYVSPW